MTPLPLRNISADEINELPLRAYEGPVHVITDPDKTAALLSHVGKFDRIGFDTETKPVFVRGQVHKVALLQLATPERVYLVRLTHTGLTPALRELLQTDDIKKVGVGLRDDIKALQQLQRFEPRGFLELAHLAKAHGLEVESVKKLAALLLGFRISKSAQTSNWEAPTLTEKQISYAATDAWVCLEVYKRLHNR